jgi:hypothetical protein
MLLITTRVKISSGGVTAGMAAMTAVCFGYNFDIMELCS